MKLRLRAVLQPPDIRAVLPYAERGDQEEHDQHDRVDRHGHRKESEISEDGGQNKQQRYAADRTDAHVAGGLRDQHEKHKQHDGHPPVEGDDERTRAGDALSAAQHRKDREVMPEDRTEARKHGDEGTLIDRRRPEDHMHHQDRYDGLRDIKQQYRRTRLLSEGTADIRRARITGALLIDIDPLGLRIQIAIRDVTEDISHHQGNDHVLYIHHSSSPAWRSRIRNFSGVPGKPKASRI